MTVVYLDLVFFLNMIANYLLLLGAGRIAGASLCRWRIALGAAVGGVYAAILFVPGMEWLGVWLCKLMIGMLMPLISYSGERSLLRIILTFFAASAGLAGLVLGVEMFGGACLSLPNGVLYSDFDLRLLLLLFMLCYFILSLIFRRTGQHTRRELIELCLEFQQTSIKLTALLDNGHTLTDSATNKTIVVADASRLTGVLPRGIDLSDPIEGIKQCRQYGMEGVRLIPYRAVGVDCGLLLAIKAKSVLVGGRSMGSLLVALSPTPVDDNGAFQALIGGN